MNKATHNFLKILKRREDVLSVIMFGSQARGNNRPGSDVDLVVILTEGFRRAVEYHEGQAFEIIYTTADGALAYWESHIDDAAGLWAVAKILYDKDGIIAQLKNQIQELLDKGKQPFDEYQLEQFRFDAEDTLKYVEHIFGTDPTTANLVLGNKVFNLTELFFDIRQLWIPAPKQRMEKIKEISPGLHALLTEFYNNKDFKERLETAKSMVPLVF